MSLSTNELEKILKEAFEKSETKKKRKFVESVDVVVNLKNVNLKDPNRRFNNEIELPNTVDEKTALCFFVEGDQLVQAGNLNLVAMGKDAMETMGKSDKAEKRKFVNKYDYFVANTETMRLVAKNFGKLFGTHGKMPRPQPQGYGVINPGDNLSPTLDRYKRVVRMKLQKYPIIQYKIGRKDMPIKDLAQNLKASIEWIEQKLEKGRQNIKSVFVKTTMGEAVKVKVS
jgi:large subunit ribosomal protein L1